MDVIIDSYAWVEYFIGSEKGEVLRKLFLNDSNSFFTIECCLAEMKGWALRENKDFDKMLKVIRANSEVLELDEQDWIDAAIERFEQRKKQKDFGMFDAAILVKQKKVKCKVISGDKHFKDLKSVIFLG